MLCEEKEKEVDGCCTDVERFLRAGCFQATRVDHKYDQHDDEISKPSVYPARLDKNDQCPLPDFETTVHKCLRRHPVTQCEHVHARISILS